jgi:hypothetical protein
MGRLRPPLSCRCLLAAPCTGEAEGTTGRPDFRVLLHDLIWVDPDDGAISAPSPSPDMASPGSGGPPYPIVLVHCMGTSIGVGGDG